MGFFKNVLKGATTLNPKKSVKHFVGSIVDPAGTTLREGRGKDSLPSNAKGYYDPADLSTPKVIGAPPTRAPKAPVVLPPIGSHAMPAPPLPGMGVAMSSPKIAPTMQSAATAAAAAQSIPGATRAFKSSAAPAYQAAKQGAPLVSPSITAPAVAGK